MCGMAPHCFLWIVYLCVVRLPLLVISEILLVYEHSDCAFISFSFQCQIVSVDVSFCLSEYVSSAVEGPRFLAFFGVQAKEGGPFQLHGCAAQRTNAARFLVLFLVVFFKVSWHLLTPRFRTKKPIPKLQKTWRSSAQNEGVTSHAINPNVSWRKCTAIQHQHAWNIMKTCWR